MHACDGLALFFPVLRGRRSGLQDLKVGGLVCVSRAGGRLEVHLGYIYGLGFRV